MQILTGTSRKRVCQNGISIGNRQYGFECNLGKTCTSEFFKNVENCTSLNDECNLFVFEKLMSVCFIQISRETILLFANNLCIQMIETR